MWVAYIVFSQAGSNHLQVGSSVCCESVYLSYSKRVLRHAEEINVSLSRTIDEFDVSLVVFFINRFPLL
jgi:hypothetical protein